MLSKDERRFFGRLFSGAGIIAYFLIAGEFIIMISPFAFFFYSVFNPILHFLSRSPATRWLLAFFLPHMVFPPSVFLEGVRIGGSILFVLGALLFLVPMAQVYLGKLFKTGMASRGVYRWIRHPQYLGLAVCGLGMAILWPRFLVLGSLWIMVILYYWLARDEERRMTRDYGDGYRDYMSRTGMFLPRRIEKPISAAGARIVAAQPWRPLAMAVAAGVILVGGGFSLRALTVSELPTVTRGDVTVLSILPEDDHYLKTALTSLTHSGVKLPAGIVLRKSADYLCYLMPVNYIMQGMIADTGQPWHLYKQHHTLKMITDWVIHPFRHLRQPPMPGMAIKDPAQYPYRRIGIVRVKPRDGGTGPKALLSIAARRAAVGYVDLDVKSGKLVDGAASPGETAWQDVPTPVF